MDRFLKQAWILVALQVFLMNGGAVEGLKCFVGLGNTSTRNMQELVECPAKKYYVCVKMYGGGMGDQIQRYCEKIKREDYNDLLDIEEKLQNNEEYANSLVSNPTCKPSKHNGRNVIICLCSMDKCNGSWALGPGTSHLIPSIIMSLLIAIQII